MVGEEKTVETEERTDEKAPGLSMAAPVVKGGVEDGGTWSRDGAALWSGTNKNKDVSTRLLALLFARSLAPLTRLLAPDCSLRSRPPLRSLPRSWDSE